jgi:hypothetical protein
MLVIPCQVQCLLQGYSNVSGVTRSLIGVWEGRLAAIIEWGVGANVHEGDSKPAPLKRHKGAAPALRKAA